MFICSSLWHQDCVLVLSLLWAAFVFCVSVAFCAVIVLGYIFGLVCRCGCVFIWGNLPVPLGVIVFIEYDCEFCSSQGTIVLWCFSSYLVISPFFCRSLR